MHIDDIVNKCYYINEVTSMAFFQKEIDITRNIKVIEWLKTELLTDVAELFKALIHGVKEDTEDFIAETISNLILICYLLAKRLGIGYNTIDLKIENKLKLGILEGDKLEKYYGDLSELSKHMHANRSNYS